MIPALRAWLGLLVPRRVEVDGLSLRVPAGVLDPVLFRTGAWFAREVAASVRPGERLLDLGCGTGVVGLLAARAGARVVAVDIDPRACAAARVNGLPDVRRGDLFSPVAGDRFDRVCFNPPYFAARPAAPWRGALWGGPGMEVVRRFDADLLGALAPGGEGWLAWSEHAPPAETLLDPAWTRRRVARVDGERLELWMRRAAG